MIQNCPSFLFRDDGMEQSSGRARPLIVAGLWAVIAGLGRIFWESSRRSRQPH